MPWNGQGGGPWGGGSGPGPWGSGSGGRGGKGPGPQGSGPKGPDEPPPSLDDLLRRAQDYGRQLFSGGGDGNLRIAGLVCIALVALWLATGIYRVQPDEEGVELRFGAFHALTEPGLHYHWPAPIERVETPKVTLVNRTEIGVESNLGQNQGLQENLAESLMLTGDENIVDIHLSVFWKIKDAKAYLFNVRDPEVSVKSAAESAIREIVGRTPIASVLSEGRAQVEADTEKLLQSILDSYGAGLQITQVQLQKVDPPQPVIEAFRDVQRARTDLERARNEAEGYHNDIVPRARGDAEKLIQDANAYKQEILARSQGDAQRFLSVLTAYRAGKDVTAERLYLETMENILKNSTKILIDPSAANVVPYLPLPDLAKPRPPVPVDPALAGAASGRAR